MNRFAPRYAFLRFATASLAVSTCFFACIHQQPHESNIYVDRPEVFTRERLLNRRLTEQYWLEQQLEKPVDTTFQGYRDVREFKGFYAKLEAEMDPTAYIKGDTAKINADKNRIDAETARLKSLQARELAARELANTANASTSAKPEAAGATAPSSSASSPAAPTAPSTDPFANASLTERAPLPDPSDIMTSKASLTSVEKLRDQVAYRNTVQAFMREQELDDTHDLYGRTLYTLKFDIGILSASRPNSLGLVRGKLSVDDSEKYNETSNTVNARNLKLLDQWRRSVNDALRDDALARQQLWLADKMAAGPERGQRDVSLATIYLADPSAHGMPVCTTIALNKFRETFSSLQGLLDRINTGQTISPTAATPGVESATPPNKDDDYLRLLAVATVAPLLRDLPKIVCFEGVETFKLAGQTFYLPRISIAEGGDTSFANILKDAPGDFYVYTVEPKELAQNISDVAAKETLLNLVGSLGASLPQASFTSIKAYAEYIRRSQHLLQGILRKPLVVGFSKNSYEFAWIFGPRFQISEKGDATFNHTPVQHSVQASIVVPGWWRKVRVTIETAWIDEEGNTVTELTTSKPFEVDLPGDISSLTSLLAASSRTGRPEPRIINVVGNVAQGPTKLLVEGQELWRNPEVYVEAQKADRVQVLPDMRGITASWNGLSTPPGKKPGDPLNVRVVTSGGIDVFPVSFVESGAPAKTSPFLTLSSKAIIPDSSSKRLLRFDVDSLALPPSYAALKVILKSSDPNDPPVESLVFSPALDSRPSTIVWEFEPSPAPAWWTRTQRVSAAAHLQSAPKGPWVNVSTPSNRFVFFGAADDARGSLVRNAIDTSKPPEKDLGVDFAPNLEFILEAFPDFAAAWSAGTLRLQLIENTHKRSTFLPITDKRLGSSIYITAGAFDIAMNDIAQQVFQRDFDSGDKFSFSVLLVNERGDKLPVVLKNNALAVTYP